MSSSQTNLDNGKQVLDLTKPVTTRDGRAVRILCTDRNHSFPVVALVKNKGTGEDELMCFTSEGKYFKDRGECILDLINPKEKLYMLVWKSGPNEKYFCDLYDTDAERIRGASIYREQGWTVHKTFEVEVD